MVLIPGSSPFQKTFMPNDKLKQKSSPQNSKKYEIFDSWDSHMVTHCNTNQPQSGLKMAERTRHLIFLML
jgi:hypothetical protein